MNHGNVHDKEELRSVRITNRKNRKESDTIVVRGTDGGTWEQPIGK